MKVVSIVVAARLVPVNVRPIAPRKAIVIVSLLQTVAQLIDGNSRICKLDFPIGWREIGRFLRKITKTQPLTVWKGGFGKLTPSDLPERLSDDSLLPASAPARSIR
jgi:hypothetical protein